MTMNTDSTQAPRICQSCKGTGKRTYSDKPCLTCNGQVNIEAPDVQSILTLIKGRKGLRSKAPDVHGVNWTLLNLRAYYVWRLACFQGGMDVTTRQSPLCFLELAFGILHDSHSSDNGPI